MVQTHREIVARKKKKQIYTGKEHWGFCSWHSWCCLYKYTNFLLFKCLFDTLSVEVKILSLVLLIHRTYRCRRVHSHCPATQKCSSLWLGPIFSYFSLWNWATYSCPARAPLPALWIVAAFLPFFVSNIPCCSVDVVCKEAKHFSIARSWLLQECKTAHSIVFNFALTYWMGILRCVQHVHAVRPMWSYSDFDTLRTQHWLRHFHWCPRSWHHSNCYPLSIWLGTCLQFSIWAVWYPFQRPTKPPLHRPCHLTHSNRHPLLRPLMQQPPPLKLSSTMIRRQHLLLYTIYLTQHMMSFLPLPIEF